MGIKCFCAKHFLNFSGAASGTAVGLQAFEGAAVISLGVGAYDAGAFAGSMATALGQKIGDW